MNYLSKQFGYCNLCVENYHNFLIGFGIPTLIALIAIGYKLYKGIKFNIYYFNLYLLALFIGFLVFLYQYITGSSVSNLNLQGMIIIVFILFLPSIYSFKNKSYFGIRLIPLDLISLYLMVWSIILIIDLLVSFFNVSGFKGIGGKGVFDGLILIPIGSVIWFKVCYLILKNH